MRLTDILYHLTTISGVVPLILFLFFKYLHKDFFVFKKASFIIYFFAFFTIFEITIGKYVNQNDYYYFVLYSILEYFLFIYVFKHQEISIPKFFFPIFEYTFLLLMPILFFGFSKSLTLLEISAYLSCVSFLLIISYFFFWFKDCFIFYRYSNLLDVPFFYFISGMILYYSGVITLFLITQQINNLQFNLQSYWVLNLVFTILYRSLLAVSIWKARKI